jgi:hypothetical protein
MHVVEVVLRSALAAGALLVVLVTVVSAVKTVVVPRAIRARLTAFVFVTVRRVFERVGRRQSDYFARDATMALFAPTSLLMLPLTWLVLTFLSYAVVFLAISPGRGVGRAVAVSGSYLFTLGTDPAGQLLGKVAGFSEAGFGLGLLALLITFLPSMYTAFSRRETLVALMEVRAGTPPSAVVMLVRHHTIGWLDRLEDLWRPWEQWFVEVEESHTSYGALCFFRSSHPEHSWITAAGCVLDAAALTASTLDLGGRQPDAELCIRSGFVSLRRLADFFALPYDADPAPTDPISVTRDEFDDACASLEKAGVPLKADRDQCWADFSGWRVNYDTVLLRLAALVFAPVAPWSSDRSPAFASPPIFRLRGSPRRR